MKKKSEVKRLRDVRRTLRERYNKTSKVREFNTGIIKKETSSFDWLAINEWVQDECKKGLIISHSLNGKKLKRNGIVLQLPPNMNFSKDYDGTVQCLTAIRKLASLFENIKSNLPKKALKLASVNFDNLCNISTSAALVLTAEVSRWDTTLRKKLVPNVKRWNDDIFIQFEQLGFFDLFENKPKHISYSGGSQSQLDFVRYVKGSCGNLEEGKEKKKLLKKEIMKLVGDKIDKWTILHSGLSEAVTNVTHHAYPANDSCEDKSWYLTGSYNKQSKEMKIAFFDQGVGIPNSLPVSQIWEKVLDLFSKWNIPKAEFEKHATLLEAAVKIDRTSTEQNDRGKGLQDLLEFIRERKEGYLSIFSYHGLYKCWIKGGKEYSKAESMERPLFGTLIIWSVSLK
ncbi:hypothetical protein OPS25_07735 [Alteromonas ponticola]|uniref:ATP-binding protein n=1 Tax=Alteromonas aquimaris TaxID=2998417 RepID=A0ABT3P6I3_9ALTE|nr:hypothetical protein [Alteromonas aquimaris]MCW8108381.1 hypothetical protein [Alteromonas aquimaris]